MNAKNSFKNCFPAVMSVAASFGVIATAVLTAQASIKAADIIRSKTDKNDKLPAKEMLASTWKCYIPATIVGLSTIACIMSANTLNKRQQETFAGAYALIHKSYQNYKQKVIDIYGREAHERILQELSAEKADKTPLIAQTWIGCTTLGFDDVDDTDQLFYDAMGDRYFTSTFIRVLEAEYHLNRNFTLGWIPSLNDFYEFLGLSKTDYGETVGWTNSNGDYYWIDFHHDKMRLEDGTEYWILDSIETPSTDFLNDI